MDRWIDGYIDKIYDVSDMQTYNMRTGEWKKGRVNFDT